MYGKNDMCCSIFFISMTEMMHSEMMHSEMMHSEILECAILRRALNPRMRDLTPSAQLSNAGKDETRSAKSIRTPGVK